MENKTIFVKVGRWGGKVTEYAVPMGIDFIQLCNKFNIVIQPDEEPQCNGNWFVRNSVISDNCTIMICKNSKITIRVARVGETLVTVSVDKLARVHDALKMAGKTPNENEEVWVHKDGELQGRKIVLMDTLVDGLILVVEPKKNVYNKVLKIVSDVCEDMNGEWEECTQAICKMLKNDYNIV